MAEDPRMWIAHKPMSRMQLIAIGLAVMLNALDGFDVLSISFAAPGIAAQWHIDRAALGVVLSMELIGMAIGSVIFGSLADRHGRRPTTIGCLLIMAIGMFLASGAGNVVQLSAYRLLTGLGVGGMLATTNAIVAEYANAKRRNLLVALMAGGYPMGAVIGGAIASLLLAHGDWHMVFLFGAVATAACIPLVLLFMPETISYLMIRRPPNTLKRINATLARMGHDQLKALPDIAPSPPGLAITDLFSRSLWPVTLLLTLTYFAHIITFYFILKWVPKIVTDMGFAPSAAGFVLVWANVGGAAGAVLFSILTQFVQIRPLLIATMILSALLVTVFGQMAGDLTGLTFAASIAGFCTNAGVVGIYAMVAQGFPTRVRAGGTGFVVGIGRGGAALSPIVAGWLFQTGWSLGGVATLMATGSIVAALALLAMRYSTESEAA